MDDDRILQLTRGVLLVFLVANAILVAGFLLVILLSLFAAPAIDARLIAKYGPRLDVSTVLLALRLLMASAMVAGAMLHVVFARLLAILATVRRGDPFTAANAARLQAIGWALLGLQLLDLALGGFTAWFAALHVEFLDWSPALGGWVAVPLVFVLARVFKRGAAMRDDLAMTV